MLLEDFINKHEGFEITPETVFTIKVWKKSQSKYVGTSVTNLPINVSRTKGFMSRNALNHEVVFFVTEDNTVEIYTKAI